MSIGRNEDFPAVPDQTPPDRIYTINEAVAHCYDRNPYWNGLREAGTVHYQLPSRSPEDILPLDPKSILSVKPKHPGGMPFHSLHLEIDTTEKRVALSGQMGASKYLIDPSTGSTITPGTHEFERLGADSIRTKDGIFTGFGAIPESDEPQPSSVVSMDISRGVTAFDIRQMGVDPAELSWSFPVMYDGNKITQHRHRPKTHSNTADQLDPAPDEDIFNLTSAENVHPGFALADEIYESAMRGLITYTRRHQGLQDSLTGDAIDVTLPSVHNQVGAEFDMTVAPTANGNTQLIFTGRNFDGSPRKDSGFHLVRSPDKHTVLVHADPDKDLAIDEPDYTDQLRVAGKVIATYFDKLNIQADVDAPSLNVDFAELTQIIARQKKPSFLSRLKK